MRRLCQITILTVFAILLALTTVSCNKKVKKIKVDNQFAISIFNDTISLREILHEMDSSSNTWLRVRNDSVFVFYADSVNVVLNARDLLSQVDVSFTTNTNFNMPDFEMTTTQDTVIIVDRFMTVPFHYDDFSIEEVELRSGSLSFNLSVEPNIAPLQKLEIYSYQMLNTEGEPLMLTINNANPGFDVDLANFIVLPEDDTVAFGARVYLHLDSGTYQGGEHNCSLSGSMRNIGFKTVYAIVDKTLDSLFTTDTEIDFGIPHLSGQAFLPVPKIGVTYRNTFGWDAHGDINVLQFVNDNTGEVTSLLATVPATVEIEQTNGQYRYFRLDGLTDQIDALAGYTRLNFEGRATMAMPGQHISISDTSRVDLIADIEMPLSFKINDLEYSDVIDVDFGGDVSMDDYFDEIDFFIDYTNEIPLQVEMQGIFMKDGLVMDSLFNNGGSILYDESTTLKVELTERKLQHFMQANKMKLRLRVSTEFQEEPVIIKESESLALRLRILTKTSEINLDND